MTNILRFTETKSRTGMSFPHLIFRDGLQDLRDVFDGHLSDPDAERIPIEDRFIHHMDLKCGQIGEN